MATFKTRQSVTVGVFTTETFISNSGSLFLHVYFCFVVSVHLIVSIFVAVLFISTTDMFPRYGAVVVLKPADVDVSCFR